MYASGGGGGGLGSKGKTVEWGELRERGMREQGRDRAREGGGGGPIQCYSAVICVYLCDVCTKSE